MATVYPKKMDRVADLLGSSPYVVSKVALVKATGKLEAGYLLSYLWSWTATLPPERDGWFWKTMAEAFHETGMSRSEQETARRRLRELGILLEEKRGIPMKIWYKIDKDALYGLLLAYLETVADNPAGNRRDGKPETGAANRRDPARKAAANRRAKADATPDPTIYDGNPPERGKKILREKIEELKARG